MNYTIFPRPLLPGGGPPAPVQPRLEALRALQVDADLLVHRGLPLSRSWLLLLLLLLLSRRCRCLCRRCRRCCRRCCAKHEETLGATLLSLQLLLLVLSLLVVLLVLLLLVLVIILGRLVEVADPVDDVEDLLYRSCNVMQYVYDMFVITCYYSMLVI